MAGAISRLFAACNAAVLREGELVALRYMGLEHAPTELKELDADSLTKLRTDTIRALKKFAKGRPRDLASKIVPAKKKAPAGHLQRIALEPERIELVGLDGW